MSKIATPSSRVSEHGKGRLLCNLQTCYQGDALPLYACMDLRVRYNRPGWQLTVHTAHTLNKSHTGTQQGTHTQSHTGTHSENTLRVTQELTGKDIFVSVLPSVFLGLSNQALIQWF